MLVKVVVKVYSLDMREEEEKINTASNIEIDWNGFNNESIINNKNWTSEDKLITLLNLKERKTLLKIN